MRHNAKPLKRHRFWSVLAFGLILSIAGSWIIFDRSVAELNNNIVVADVTESLGTDRPKPAVAAAPTPDTGVRNILILGSDQRTGVAGFENQSATIEGARADTAMLVHLSADRKRIQVLSIPRDTVGPIPACKLPDKSMSSPQRDRFNAAFSLGGVACTIKTLEAMTNVRIDDYVVVNFDGFQQMVDALGGVKMCISQPIKDREAEIDLKAGSQLLTGQQALGFVRVRHNIGDGSDLGRIPRQQAFMSALLNQVKSTNILTNLPQLYQFLSAATSSLQTSPALGNVQALAGVALSVKDIKPELIEFATLPIAPDPNNPNVTVVLDSYTAKPLFTALRLDKSFHEPTGTSSAGATAGATASATASASASESTSTASSATAGATTSSAATPTPTTTPTQPNAVGVCK